MLTIGLLIDNLFDDYEILIWESILERAKELDKNLICFAGGSLDSPDFFYAEKNVIYELACPQNIDGIMAISGSLGNYISFDKLLGFYSRFARVPIVSIGIPIEGIPSVYTDNGKGMEELVSHCIEIHNRKKIAFICGPSESFDAKSRLEAYERTLLKFGLDINPDLVLPGDFTRLSGRDAVRMLIEERKAEFDTVIGANDYMSINAMKELADRGYRIPEDVIICGFDYSNLGQAVEPPLTTVQQPLYDIGKLAFEMLLDTIEGKEVRRQVALPPRLVVKRSCGCFLSEPVYRKRAMETRPEKDREETEDLSQGSIVSPLFMLKELSGIEGRAKLGKIFEGIADAVIKNKGKDQDTDFFRSLEQAAAEAFKAGMDINLLYGPLIALFEKTLPDFGGDQSLAGGGSDAFVHKALVFLGECAEHLQKQKRIRSEQESLVLRRISQEFIHTFNYEQIKALLEWGLPLLGIKSSYFCLYTDSSRAYSRLFFALENGEVKNEQEGAEFQSRLLIPWNIKNPPGRLSLIVMPVFFKKEKIGFAIFEIGTIDGTIYETLASGVGSAMKGASLVEQVQRHATALEDKVRERTAELERVAKELALANEQKTRFFVNIAHETKSPLTLIRNYLDKYIKTKGEDPNLAIVKRNIDKLLRDMVNFLDSEKLERGQIFYNHNQVVDLCELIDVKVFLFREAASKKKISIGIQKSDERMYIKADPFAIDRVVNNLLDNAIKYTNQGGTIEIKLASAGGGIVFEVKDSGIGMTEEQMSYIFEPYYQLSHRKRNIQGIGMGLYIVKEIISSLGASIRLETKENEGSLFRIEFLPYEPKEGDEIADSSKYSIPIEREPPPAHVKESDLNPQKRVVLLVDDNLDMLSFLRNELAEKYNVFTAENGREALSRIDVIPVPDIIISDIMMAEMDGHELFLHLLKREEYKHIPFIFLTARSTIDEKLRGLEEGAVDYIAKPFVIDELILKIDAIILNQVRQKKMHIRQIGERIVSSLSSLEPEKPGTEDYINFDLVCNKYRISSREKEVIILLSKGLLNKEISDKLGISIKTLDSHIHNIYKKFNVQNKVELINILKG